MDIERELEARADPATRDWWERYLKGAVPFRGVKMAGIREVTRLAWPSVAAMDDPVGFALARFEGEFSEDKLVGVLLLAEHLLAHLDAGAVPRLAEPFERGWIEDWSTCDWYCVKVLGKVIERDPDAAEAIAGWRAAQSLWQRRAAAVAFVNLVPKGLHHDVVLRVCESNVRDPERFMQTSVGWTLGEMRKADPAAVDRFLVEWGDRMTSEARRRAAGT